MTNQDRRHEHRRQQLRDERADFVGLLEQLDAADWTKPTRCTGWTVADVAGHVLAWERLLAGPTVGSRTTGTLRLLRLWVTSGFGVDRMNERLRRRAPRTPEAIVAAFTSRTADGWKWRFDLLTPGAQLAECVLHHEDVRDATGRPRVVPPDRVATALRGIRWLPGLSKRRQPPAEGELAGIDALLQLAGRTPP